MLQIIHLLQKKALLTAVESELNRVEKDPFRNWMFRSFVVTGILAMLFMVLSVPMDPEKKFSTELLFVGFSPVFGNMVSSLLYLRSRAKKLRWVAETLAKLPKA